MVTYHPDLDHHPYKQNESLSCYPHRRNNSPKNHPKENITGEKSYKNEQDQTRNEVIFKRGIFQKTERHFQKRPIRRHH